MGDVGIDENASTYSTKENKGNFQQQPIPVRKQIKEAD